jgi:hypothetical protein
MALRRGRPLQDVSLSDAVVPRLTAIEEQVEQVWTDWVEVRLQLGDHDRLIGELRMAAESQPLRERIWEQLIVALYRARRRSDALDIYQRIRGILEEQLGIEPSPTLQLLHTAILNDDPRLLSSTASTTGTLTVGLSSAGGHPRDPDSPAEPMPDSPGPKPREQHPRASGGPGSAPISPAELPRAARDVTLVQEPSFCPSGTDVRFVYDEAGTRVVKDGGHDNVTVYPNESFSQRNLTAFKHIFVGNTRLVSKVVEPERRGDDRGVPGRGTRPARCTDLRR